MDGTHRIKYGLTHEKVRVEVADGLEMSGTSYQAESWNRPRRIIMAGQETGKRPNAAGKQVGQSELFEDGNDFGKYRHSCLVANPRLPAKIVYNPYRGRADSGNRIKELKYDFSIGDFWATEACGSFIVMAYNFMSLFRHATHQLRQKAVSQNYTLRVDFYTGLFGQDKRQAYSLSGKILKNKESFPSYLGEIKGFLVAVRHWEILMTDLG